MKELIKKKFKKEDLEKIKTPQFLYFHSQTEDNIKEFKKFSENDIKILYALKANNYTKLVKSFVKEGYGFEIASVEELKFLVEQGANPTEISFSAPSKLEKDLKKASSLGVKYYAFDSEIEVEKIMKNVKDPILVARIGTPNKESAFDLSSKFGMDNIYFEYILKLAQENNWPLKSLTFHVGSQNNSLGAWKDSLVKIKEFINLAKDYGIEIEYLNLGGGIPVQYNGRTRPLSYYIDGICNLVKNLRKCYSFKKVFIEPGRSLSANTMALLTEVIDIKPYKSPPIVIVDTSVFTGIIEPLENFEYPLYSLEQLYDCEDSKTTKYYKIGGCSCDGCDIIHKRIALPKDLDLGKRLIILYAGAYTFVYEKFHMKSYAKIIDFK